jgi:PAS domain S-box-containing protein
VTVDKRIKITIRLLVATVVIETSLALVFRIESVVDLRAGETSLVNWLALPGLAALVLVAVSLLRARRDLLSLRRQVDTSEQRMAALEATSAEWLWHADPDLVVTYSSPAVADVLGYSSAEVVGHSFLDLLEPDDATTAREVVRKSRASGTGWTNMELRWRHRDGRVVVLQGSGVPMFDDHARVVGFRGTLRPTESQQTSHREHDATRRRIDDLAAGGRLRIALQPIIDLASGRWVTAEALARFPDGRGPDTWFREAREAGRGTMLEAYSIHRALEDALPRLAPDIGISLNASPAMILDPRLRRMLEQEQVPLERITVEITEHAAVTEYDDIRAALLPLRERGMRLAVDDIGAGYASFSHVLRLRPDIIKLDRSLIEAIDEDAAKRAIVTAMMLVALEIDATVTAEGVETAGELATVMSLGVDHGQGYHLARPDTGPATWASWRQRTWLPGSSASTQRV